MQGGDVTHFVHIDRQHQPKGQRPAEEAGIKAKKERHWWKSAQLGQPEKEQLPLREDEQNDELELEEKDGDRRDDGAVFPVFRAHPFDLALPGARLGVGT